MQVDEHNDFFDVPADVEAEEITGWRCNSCAAEWDKKPDYKFCNFCGSKKLEPVYNDDSTQFDITD